MWGNIFMNVSWLISAILAIVGILKLFFKKFKEKHPKFYKFTFFILSLVLVAAGSIVVELYILEGTLASIEFALLISFTTIGVVGGYTGYECTGLKDGLHKLSDSLKNWAKNYKDSKAYKIIDKVNKEIDKVVNKVGGINNVVSLYNSNHQNIELPQAGENIQDTEEKVQNTEENTQDVVETNDVQVVIEEK